MSDQKLWGGRFEEATDTFVEEFTASVRFDQRLAMQDIAGSKAHAQMLGSSGILPKTDVDAILHGLTTIEQEIRDNTFEWQVEREDVHMNIEARLTELVGDAGKKLHTGRSRNDQVATDIRLYLRQAIGSIQTQLQRLMIGILELAEKEYATIMPGFTHLQTAQPITFGHHLMAWFEMLMRDSERLLESVKRVNVMPLGSAALAGTTYPIDRNETAKLLGFTAISENSMDAVGDRDFAIEFAANASLIMMHLSRMAEEMVIWTSAQFDFVTLPDRFCTGSSIMPQKKNPDIPELVRGKTGRVYGHLISLLTLMKSQPLTYNKDNQEDKEPLFDTIDTVHNCLLAFADLVPHIQANRSSMRTAAMKGLATATDLADYLTKKGVPFRESHDIVGKAVNQCVTKGVDLSELSLDQLRQFSDLIEEDALTILTLDGSVKQRNHIGGTAPEQVINAIRRGRNRLNSMA